jgi:hypothetical protein
MTVRNNATRWHGSAPSALTAHAMSRARARATGYTDMDMYGTHNTPQHVHVVFVDNSMLTSSAASVRSSKHLAVTYSCTYGTSDVSRVSSPVEVMPRPKSPWTYQACYTFCFVR